MSDEEFHPPTVEKGIPLPLNPRRYVRQPRAPQPPSPWLGFLRGLVPGDSFVVGWWACQDVKRFAGELGLPILAQQSRASLTYNEKQYRVWILGQPLGDVDYFKDRGASI